MIREVACTRSDSKETALWIDCPQSSILANMHPCNIISNTFHSESRNRRHEHRQVCFSACRWKSCSNVELFSCWIRNAQNKHVFCHPSFISSHDCCNAQRKALLTHQCITSVSRSETHDLWIVWKLNNVFRTIAWPRNIGFTRRKRFSYRVKARNKGLCTHCLQHLESHSRHDPHIGDNIRRIRHLNSIARVW